MSAIEVVNPSASGGGGGGGGGGTSLITNNITAWADVTNGNDATAIIGRPDKPYQTLPAAVTGAGQFRGIVRANPGVYDQGSTALVLSNITGFYGSGSASCIITGAPSAVSGMVIPSDSNMEISGFSITTTASTSVPLRIGVATATNVIWRDLVIKGVADSIIYTGNGVGTAARSNAAAVTLSAYNCQFLSAFDTFNCAGLSTLARASKFNFYNSSFLPAYNASQPVIRGIVIDDASVSLFNCFVGATNGASVNYGVYVTTNGMGSIDVVGSQIFATTTNGGVNHAVLNASTNGGQIRLFGGTVDSSTTAGTISWMPSTYVGSFIGNLAEGTNINPQNINGQVVTNNFVPVLTLNGGLLLTNLATGAWIRETNGIITAGATNGTATITLDGNNGSAVLGSGSTAVRLGYSDSSTVAPGYAYIPLGLYANNVIQATIGPIYMMGRANFNNPGSGSVINLGAAYTANALGSMNLLNLTASGVVTATNGFASFSTNSVAIAATGYTNTMTISGSPVDVDVYFSGATAALYDQNHVLKHTYVIGLTADTFAHMKPGWHLVGTTLVGDAIGH